MKWQPAMGAIKASLALNGVARDRWPQSGHWDWTKKVEEAEKLLGMQSFCVTVGNVLQGMMRVDLTRRAKLPSQKGLDLAYVDYLEVAPWNTSFGGSPVSYKGTGTALMIAAAELSRQEGLKGRVGLHSLPQSVGFYQHLGMSDLGPDPKCPELRYFEMTPEQADALLA
jgi:hypothetical protein